MDRKNSKKISKPQRLEWKESDAPKAKGNFKNLSITDLAKWLIKTRNSDKRKIIGSLNQQIVFNRNKKPEYAIKMEKTRNKVIKILNENKKQTHKNK